MPSVLGLLEERETAARVRVEELRAALRDAEVVLERQVIAVAELVEALGARTREEDAVAAGPVSAGPGQTVEPVVKGAVVPG